MLLLLTFWPLLLFASAYNQLDLIFIREYISSYEVPNSNYYVIVCRKSDVLDIVKMLSMTLQRFVTVRIFEEGLRPKINDRITFVLHLGCHNWMEILLQAEQLDLFRKPYKWLLFDRNINIPESHQNFSTNDGFAFLKTLPIYVDSDFKIVRKNPSGKISVTSIYKISQDRDLTEEPLVEWTSEGNLTVLNGKIIAVRRWNLQGLKVPSTMVITEPDSLAHLDDMVDKHKDTTTKVTYNVIKLVEPLFNISLVYRIDNSWGIPYKNGSWSGMVGDLQRGDSIIGVAPLFLLKDRLDILEYYATVTPTEIKFIFISPPLSHSNNIFALPFATVVWVCCLALFVVACTFLFFAINCEEINIHETEEFKPSQKIPFSDIVVYNIGAICLQGTAAETHRPAGRILTIFVYLAYMFLYISYSASIVAILQSSDSSITTLFDLLRSPMKAGADNVNYSQYYFRTANDTLRKKFYETKIAPKPEAPNFLPPEIGIKKVQEGLFAFHVETSVGYQIVQKTFAEDEKCGLRELKTSFFQVGNPWLVMKKNNPYGELFRIGSKRLIEAGLKTRTVRIFYAKKPVCLSKSSRFVSVGMVDCYYAFMLLICGWILAVGVFLAETIVRKYRKFQFLH